jgi:hypothetical protein
LHPVRLAYQPPDSSTFLSGQDKQATSNQSIVLFSQNKSAPAIIHQPNEHAVDMCTADDTIINLVGAG